MSRCLRWLVFVCCVMARPLFAQDAMPPDASETDEVHVESTAASAKAGEAQPDAPVPSPADDLPKTKSPEVFVPSEDISEDLAVSFPVDI